MEYGYVCLSNSKKSFTGKIIKAVTRSQWSHSFLTVVVLNTVMAFEAARQCVAMVPFERAYQNNDEQGYRLYKFKVLTDDTRDLAIRGLFDSLETSYGFLELPWFGWRALCKLFGKDIKHKDNWCQDGVICSELVAQYITNAGYPFLFAGYGKGSVNAQDIFEIVESHPEVFELVEAKE